MKFIDLHVFQSERFALGIEDESGRYYLSIPVANRLVDYEEYYEISKDEFDAFDANHASAVVFAHECRSRRHDSRLIVKPGSDRGSAI